MEGVMDGSLLAQEEATKLALNCKYLEARKGRCGAEMEGPRWVSAPRGSWPQSVSVEVS